MSVSNIQILKTSSVEPIKKVSVNVGGLTNGNQPKQLQSNIQQNKQIKIVSNVVLIPPIKSASSATTTIKTTPSTNLDKNKKLSTSVHSIATKNQHPNQVDEYRKLFAALFEIKDAEVRSRVMKAINGTPTKCPQCSFDLSFDHKSKTMLTNVPNTTDINNKVSTAYVIVTDGKKKVTLGKKYPGIVEDGLGTIDDNFEQSSTSMESPGLPKKNYQIKRQPHATKGILSNINNLVTIPQHVIFKPSNNNISHIKKPFTYKPIGIVQSKNIMKKPTNVESITKHSKQLTLADRPSSPAKLNSTEYSKCYNELMAPYTTSNYYLQEQCVNETTANLDFTEEKLFMQKMQMEWHVALKLDPESKLLPIHTAALIGDIHRLKRQVLVFEYRKLDLAFKSMESDGNTALHYAAISTSDNAYDIVEYLIKKGMKLTLTNNNGDSVLQYAAKYCDNLVMFRKLLKSIDKYQDLLHQNDNGLPLLHIIVNGGKFLFAQALIETINEKLNIKGEVGENCWNTDELIELYHKHISSFIRPNNLKLQLNKRKMEMLNKRDSVSGRTALFIAVRSELKDFVYLLLANYADPRIKDMNDIDCTLCNEDADRVINAAIYNADFLYKFHIDPYFRKLLSARKTAIVNNGSNNISSSSTSNLLVASGASVDEVTNKQSSSTLPQLPQIVQLKRKLEIKNDEKIVKKIC